ncbi:MAG: CpsD/CapB family tyrosine-protein kinase [Clostridia bacterium]|nr:CpsD/CapB family tyrosine-protein kinase [Clostridia bacterium]
MLFRKKKRTNYQKSIVVDGSHNKIQRGYDRLKDNVLYMNADGKYKVLQFESAVSSEGKTTVLCNLAVDLGLTEKKVVIVDLDFYHPSTHRVMKVSNDNGIAEYMLGNIDKNALIKHTDYKNVDIVTRGAEIYNSSLVLLADKFKELIKSLREEYDYVLLDCPPVLQVSDYMHVSKLSDGVILIVAYAQTTRSQVAEEIKELRKNGANILGSVFTMYDGKNEKNYGRDYYYDLRRK